FLPEETEFYREEGIEDKIQSNNRWALFYDNPELFEKYFLSVIAPYYIINPDLKSSYELEALGFGGFLNAIKRTPSIKLSEIKEKFLKIPFSSLKFKINNYNEKIKGATARLQEIIVISNQVIRDFKNKFLVLNKYNLVCPTCKKVGIEYLPSFESSHFTPINKVFSYREIRRLNHVDQTKLLKNENIIFECSNCHLNKQATYYYLFKELIQKSNLFESSANEIDKMIDKEILKVKNKVDTISNFGSERNFFFLDKKEFLAQKSGAIKRNIKKWIKKRFVFDFLFNGQCIYCGNSNLVELCLHHIDIDFLLENGIEKSGWNDLANLECEEIIERIKNEKSVSLCANCHALIHSDYRLYIEMIFSDIYPQEKIINLKTNVSEIYNNIIKSCENFRFPITCLDNNSPLKIDDVRKYEKEDKIKYILNSIYEIIEGRVFNEFSIEDIAAISDFSYNTIYEHFNNLLIPNNYIKSKIDPIFIHNAPNKQVFKLTEKGFEYIKKKIEFNSIDFLNFNFDSIQNLKYRLLILIYITYCEKPFSTADFFQVFYDNFSNLTCDPQRKYRQPNEKIQYYLVKNGLVNITGKKEKFLIYQISDLGLKKLENLFYNFY
ncbi:MAG: HNH endonuclease signature motif containing protein, partial [Candidatus Thorarchaeota archaeon]